MKSYRVLKPLAIQLGLQASVAKEGIFSRIFKRIQENLFAERGKKIEDPDWFVFKNVIYEGEESFCYTLMFEDLTHFRLFSGKREIAKGKVGEELSLPEGVQFLLEKTPSSLKVDRKYRLTISHWVAAAASLRKQLQIKTDKLNTSIYHLSYCHRNRYFAIQVLNGLMDEYRRYLKREHDQVAKEQIVYLDQKQEEIYQKLSHVFEEHEQYLCRNLKDKGFFGLEQEAQSYFLPHKECLEKLFIIDIELAKLDHFGEKGIWIASDATPFSKGLLESLFEIQDLRQQRDLLELSLQKKENYADSFEAKKEELQEIRAKKEKISDLITSLKNQKTFDLEACFDPEHALISWAKHLTDPKEINDLSEYLGGYLRLLSLKEKMLQERFFYNNSQLPEFDGIDLVTARSLFINYHNKLDSMEAELRHYAQLKEEIQQENFEVELN